MPAVGREFITAEPTGLEPFLRLRSTGRIGRARFRSANLVEVGFSPQG